tara:strand:+ start:4024 stop:7119 length:3096 start_codon:yes stop_codon:yes gene_type:complete
MGILQNYNEGNMDALRSVKYSETGTQAPYVVKDIKNPPQNNDNTIGLQLNKRIDDTSRIAQMLVDKPGLKFVGNQTLLSASELASKAKAAASKKRGQEGGATNVGAALAGAAAAAGQVLKIVGSTLAQVPVNGTGTHFVRGFTPDTYIKSGDPSGLLGFLGFDGESGATRALQGAKIIPDGNPQEGLESFPIDDTYRISKGIDSKTGALGLGEISENRYSEKDNTLDEFVPQGNDYLDSNYSAQERQEIAKTGGVILPDNVSPEYIPPITSYLKASGSSTPFGNTETELSKSRVDTPTPALAQSGSVITIQGGTATTATKETFGTTNQGITGSVAARQGYEIGPASTESIEATNSTEDNIANTQIGASIPLVKEEGARETTVTSGDLGVTSTVPENLKTVTGDTTTITPFQIDSEKAKATSTDQENTQNVQEGNAVSLKGDTRQTTATSGNLGISSNVSSSAQTVTGDAATITPFQIDSEKAKATSTDQENTQNVQGGNVVSLKGDTRQTTATSGNFGISSNVSGSTQTATGLQDVEASVFEVDNDKAKGKYATQQNTLNALTGSAVALKGDTRQTTATSGNFGISSNVPENTETVTGFQEIEATVFNINDDKAKGRSTTQENTLNALTGSSITLKGDTRQTTESPGEGLVGGRSNKVPTDEGDITELTPRIDNTYSSENTFTSTVPVDNIRDIQSGTVYGADGAIPLRPNTNEDTIIGVDRPDQNVTGEYNGTTKSVGIGTTGSFQDFRNPSSDNSYNGGTRNSYFLNYASPTINKETRVGLGNQGKKKNLTNYSITDPASIDKLNYLDVKTVTRGEDGRVASNAHTPDETESSRDLIKFNFQILTPEDTTFLYFRAFLTELSDSYTGAWDTTKYLGRAEDLYTYQGFSRSMNIGFNIAAATRKEMKPLYRKMAALASVTAPTYGGDGKFMRGTIAKVTVGDYIYEVPGIIESVNYTWNTDYNWEIAFQNQEGNIDDDMQELPQIMDCGITFKPIHSFVPEAVGTNRLLPYITNPTPNGSGKAVFIPQPQ